MALWAPRPGISNAITGTRLNDLVSEVDVMKYQHIPYNGADVGAAEELTLRVLVE